MVKRWERKTLSKLSWWIYGLYMEFKNLCVTNMGKIWEKDFSYISQVTYIFFISKVTWVKYGRITSHIIPRFFII